MDRVNLVVAADAAFCKQLAVTISGVSRFADGVPHRIFVFHDGYGPELRARVEESAGSHVDLEWIDARSEVLADAQLPEYLPPATLYRLRLTTLLPSDVERVIYLDTDVVVRGSLRGLWDFDLHGCPLGAVRDAVYPWAGSPRCVDWRTFGVAPTMPYFNAGVMVIPLQQWREERIGERVLDLLARYSLRYGDQCALNVVANGEWARVSPRWNLQSGHQPDDSAAWIVEPGDELLDALRDPAVVHFTFFDGQVKPWDANSTAAHRERWLEELDRTSWAGWRPEAPTPSRARAVARRARRAGGVLIHGA